MNKSTLKIRHGVLKPRNLFNLHFPTLPTLLQKRPLFKHKVEENMRKDRWTLFYSFNIHQFNELFIKELNNHCTEYFVV